MVLGWAWRDQLAPRYSRKALRITEVEVQGLLVFNEAYLIGSVPARREGATGTKTFLNHTV